MRLIDADELKKILTTIPFFVVTEREQFLADNLKQELCDYIDSQPTVNLWHYPSKGELPKESEYVLCLQSDGVIPYIGVYEHSMWINWYVGTTDFEPKCWQYIVPPKEEK